MCWFHLKICKDLYYLLKLEKALQLSPALYRNKDDHDSSILFRERSEILEDGNSVSPYFYNQHEGLIRSVLYQF